MRFGFFAPRGLLSAVTPGTRTVATPRSQPLPQPRQPVGRRYSASPEWTEAVRAALETGRRFPPPPRRNLQRERSLRAAAATASVKKNVLKRVESVHKLTGPGCMPGGLRPVATMASFSEVNDPPPQAASTSTQAAPSKVPLRRSGTSLNTMYFPGDFESTPHHSERPVTRVAASSDEDGDVPMVLDTVDTEAIFETQMAALMEEASWRKGLTEHRALLQRAEDEQFGPRLLAAQRARKAEAIQKEKERQERKLQRAQLRAEKRRRREAREFERKQIEEERLRREAEEVQAAMLEEQRAHLATAEWAEQLRIQLEMELEEDAQREEEEERRAHLEKETQAKVETDDERRLREAHENPNAISSKFFLYDRKWAALSQGFKDRLLTFDDMPWPSLLKVAGPQDISISVLENFLFHLDRPESEGKSRRAVLKAEVIRWHPDRFNNRVLPIIGPEYLDLTLETAGEVARTLTKMLNNC
ncbi:hypothetical protein ONZ45_g3938 [Pleurotus djamor]|nr:hypothetical protein ONZ45_g3938 [Pleurotus djamor]